MPNSYTANLNLTLPEVGGDTDAWGGHINAGLTSLDGIFTSDGTGTSVGLKVGSGNTLAVAGTVSMSGAVTLSGTTTVSGATTVSSTLTATGTVTATAATVNLGAGNTSFKDGTDATKVLKFSAAGITTATTRTLTVPDASGTVALTNNSGFMPTGTVLPFAGSSAPTDYLLCFGQAVSRTTYAALFAVVSTTYGVGDGSTTFALPDMRGRVAAGKDDMGGTAASRVTTAGSSFDGTSLGAAGGAQTVTLTAATMPAHTHTATDSGHTHTLPNGSTGNTTPSTSGGNVQGTNPGNTTGSGTANVSLSFTGGDGAHLNVQPTLVLNYIIKI